MAFAALAATALGGIASGIGSYESAQSQKAMYNYQAGIALQNQQIAKQNEGYALTEGEDRAAQSGMASRYRLGQIITAQGASGFNVNSGTNTNVQSGQQLIANTEQTTILSNAAKTAYDYDIGAVQAGEQASADKAAASNAQTAGDIGIASSILGTAGSVSSKWMQGTQSGLFPSTNILSGTSGGLGF